MKKLFALLALILPLTLLGQQQTINTGSSANDHTGDPLRTAFTKVNANFTDLYGDEVQSATASGTDTYAATTTHTAYVSGMKVLIKFINGNTGAATINLNSLGAKAIRKNVSDPLGSGDIVAGQIFLLGYDGTAFQLIGGSGGSEDAVTDVTGTTNRITSTGGTTPVIDISASYVGQTSITTLGTITTGTWGGTPINLASGVTGDLPFSNLTQGSALSVLGVTGNATADVASIAAGSDADVLRRSGTTLGFGTIGDASISGLTYNKLDFGSVSALSSPINGDEVLPTTVSTSLTPNQIRTADQVSVTGDHTLDLTDAWKTLMVTAGSPNNLTVPPNASVAFPIGTRIYVRRTGAGATTFVQGSGVTITPSLGALTDHINTTMSLEKTGTNQWYLDNGAAVTISSSDVTGALGYTPANSTDANLEWTQVTTTADQTFTSTTYADITPSSGPALAFAVSANVNYEYDGIIIFTSTNSTEGHGITINGTNLTARYGGVLLAVSTSSQVPRFTAGSFQDEVAGSTGLNSGGVDIIIKSFVKCSSAQTIHFQCKTEVGSGQSTTVKAGSYIRWRPAH